MRQLVFISFLICCCSLSSSESLLYQRKPIDLVITKVGKAPSIDGLPEDPCWSEIQSIRISGSIPIFVKVCRDESNIYVLARYPSGKSESEEPKWHWDKIKRCYVPGSEREETLSLFWTLKNNGFEMADLWVWRAIRTDPGSMADDCLVLRKNSYEQSDESGKFRFKPDKGKRCWRSRFFSKFAGDPLPRFTMNGKATGSMADVKAKGKWKDGFWTIEFKRSLSTRNADDLDMSNFKSLYLSFFPNIPLDSDLEKRSSVRLLP